MDVLWKNKILPFVSLTWSGTDTQASREISFTLPWNPYDNSVARPSIAKGDVIELREEGVTLFLGVVTSREKTAEIGTASYTAKDYMHYLLRSNGTYIFKNKTPEDITKKVCSAVQIPTTKLFKTGVNIKKMVCEDMCLYDIIIKAYRKVKSYTGRNYMPVMVGGKVSVIEKGESSGVTLTEAENITNATYSDTTDNMVNVVRIYNGKHKEVGLVQNASNVKQYGVYQTTYTKEKGVSATAGAKKELYGTTREASISSFGDLRAISGRSISIKDPATGLNGKFFITSDSHTFENGVHLMELGLAWKNTMESV